MIERTLIFLVVSLVLSGCVSLKPKPDNMKVYALGPTELAEASVDATPVYLARPELPVYLDGKRLQFRDASGEVFSLLNARWAEPLEDGVARSLSEYLTATAAVRVTGFYPWPPRSDLSVPVLRVRIFKLGASASGQIRMFAEWEVRNEGVVVAHGQYQSNELSWDLDSATSYVTGLNQALKMLSHEIARSLQF